MKALFNSSASILFALVLLLGASCSHSPGDGSAKKKQSAPETIAATPEIKTPASKYGLNWGRFSEHPAKALIEDSKLLDDFDVIVLFFSLQKKPVDLSEIGPYFKEVQEAQNEFDRKKAEQGLQSKFDELSKSLLAKKMGVEIEKIELKEYDFSRKGFPIEEIHSYVTYKDETAAALKALSEANAWASVDGFGREHVWSSVRIENLEGKKKEISLIEAEEGYAKQIVNEFSTGQRIINAFVTFIPKRAKIEERLMARGTIMWQGKIVVGEATYVVFATEKGSVISVYDMSKEKIPAKKRATK